jgi:excisionase family DNA binding protein
MIRATLSVEEAAGILGVGRSAAYAAARRGEIPTIKIGRRVLVPRAAPERLLSGPEDVAPSDLDTPGGR